MIWFVLETPNSERERVREVYESYLKDKQEGEQVMKGGLDLLCKTITERSDRVTVLYTTQEDGVSIFENEILNGAILKERLFLTDYTTDDLELTEGKVRGTYN